MTYVSWTLFAEGSSDREYYEVLIPRLINDISIRYGVRKITVPESPSIRLGVSSRTIEHVAAEICRSKDAFEILFIHSDTGGAGLQRTLENRTLSYREMANDLCDFCRNRCVFITPKHETEAWTICDQNALLEATGMNQVPPYVQLPQNGRDAERDRDPKNTIQRFFRSTRSRKTSSSVNIPYAAIAQRQSLDALRTARTFVDFENSLYEAMSTLGCFR